MKKSVLWSTKVPGMELTKEELEAVLRSSNKGMAILKKILEDRLDATAKERSSKQGYDSPAWAYHQADLNGQERTLRMILDIIQDVCYTPHT